MLNFLVLVHSKYGRYQIYQKLERRLWTPVFLWNKALIMDSEWPIVEPSNTDKTDMFTERDGCFTHITHHCTLYILYTRSGITWANCRIEIIVTKQYSTCQIPVGTKELLFVFFSSLLRRTVLLYSSLYASKKSKHHCTWLSDNRAQTILFLTDAY